MAQQQAEPRMEGFGLQKDIQIHVPEEERGQQRQAQRSNSSRRTVAVSRRGPNSRPASAELDNDAERGEDGDADLDASDERASAASDDGDDDRDDGREDLDTDLDADDAGDDDAGDDGDDRGDEDRPGERRTARSEVPDKDSRTRAQWAQEVGKLQGTIEELQRRLDAQDARNAQANDARAGRRPAGDDDEDDELSATLDEMFSASADEDEFVKAGDLEKRTKQRKKLEKQINGRLKSSLEQYASDEGRALLAVPGAREMYNEANRSGLMDKLRTKHQYFAPLIFEVMREQHNAQITKLESRHKKELDRLQKKLRRDNLDDIPAGSGNRGHAGTGQGNSRPRNPMEAAMAGLSARQGLPPPGRTGRR